MHKWIQKSQPSYDIVFWHIIESNQALGPALHARKHAVQAADARNVGHIPERVDECFTVNPVLCGSTGTSTHAYLRQNGAVQGLYDPPKGERPAS